MTGDRKKENEAAWREAVKDVTPLEKVPKAGKPGRRAKALDRQDSPRELTSPPPKSQSPFDPRLYRKIASGKAALDRVLDLHGLTEQRAFDRLVRAAGEAYEDGHRRLLVITGKGRGGTGAIRAQLPKWLSSPKLTPFVSSFEYAHRRHGGDGAFYVILRKRDRGL